MSKKSRRTKETLSLLKWIHKYPGYWELICTPNHEYMSRERMLSLLKELHKMNRPDLIFVTLSVHRNADYMVNLEKETALPLLISAWKNGEQEMALKNLTDFFA